VLSLWHVFILLFLLYERSCDCELTANNNQRKEYTKNTKKKNKKKEKKKLRDIAFIGCFILMFPLYERSWKEALTTT